MDESKITLDLLIPYPKKIYLGLVNLKWVITMTLWAQYVQNQI